MNDFLNFVRVAPRRLVFPINPGAFRLFLALLVMVYHFSSLGVGRAAVYIFFMLSGFWVDRMWRERYSLTRNPYWTFVVSRFWRLVPVMALVGLITNLLLPVVGEDPARLALNNPLHLIVSSVALLGYAWLPYTSLSPAWSLDVEMQFYLLAPLLAILLGTARGRGIVLVVAAGLSLYSAYHAPKDILPIYIVFFIIGMIAARSRWEPTSRSTMLSVGAVILLVPVLALTPWRSILLGGANPGPLHVFNIPYNVVLALAAAPFAIFTTRQRSDATDRAMADLSYVVYLLHWIGARWFMLFVGDALVRRGIEAVCFVGTPLGAYLIWRYYDKPINRLRARWVASRMVEQAPQPGRPVLDVGEVGTA
jgi:peptidoglycan/LPS O-acetylase OafA/YrhL